MWDLWGRILVGDRIDDTLLLHNDVQSIKYREYGVDEGFFSVIQYSS